MPPEDVGEKTEAPTERRRQQARSRGQVAKSVDLSAAAALLGGMVLLNIFGPAMLRDFMNLTRSLLGGSGADSAHADSAVEAIRLAGGVMLGAAGPICLALMGLTIVVVLAQVGLLLSWHPLKPSLQKISPLAGFERIFSGRSLVRMLLNLGKVALIGYVAYLTIRDKLPQIVNSIGLSYLHLTGFTAELLFTLGLRMGLILLVLAIFDYVHARYRHEQELRMTKTELREELKRFEGDPLVRERRRRVARQLGAQRMQYQVPNADVVITNPTELAIALKYDPQTTKAPQVMAKGAGLMAQRIRQIAIRSGVPIVQRPALTRSLYKVVEVDRQIPSTFYKAIAEILAYVYEIGGKGYRIDQTSAVQADSA